MGAGAVIVDDDGRVLLVNPTYKADWEVPGGVVELNESPSAACKREIAEELGIEVEIGELMCVDYSATTPDYVESLMFLFRVSALTSREIGSIRLPAAELSEFRFCSLDEAALLLDSRLGARLAAVLGSGPGRGPYLENQKHIS